MKENKAKEHYITISPDVDYYYQDEEGMCGGSTDDVIENTDRIIQPMFSIVLPGMSIRHNSNLQILVCLELRQRLHLLQCSTLYPITENLQVRFHNALSIKKIGATVEERLLAKPTQVIPVFQGHHHGLQLEVTLHYGSQPKEAVQHSVGPRLGFSVRCYL